MVRLSAQRAAVLLGTGMVAAIALGGAAAPAAAASTDLLVSRDGIHFSSELAGGLFDGSGLLVPRGSIASDLWVRNPTAAPAVLRVSARDVVISSNDLADGVTMSAWNSGTDTTRSATLRTIAQCQILVPSQSIAAGATVKMVVTYTMADFTGVTAQHDNASVGLMVSMRDAEAGAFPASACKDDGVLISSTPARTGSPPTSLPGTGTDFAVPLLVAGGLLVGVGLFFVAGRRRREHDES